ncbi:hypothetical protein ACFFOS_27750 [Nocardioides kongjuensis]|uniref:Uncharacterized protein n=1 Tax=Nocardioides kongjuensis TaxID=349522 RepID=A0A852RNW6_9ACTN|nr:hypothetical protein [Nocardioides kongjuensis]NYD32695.1 hypothetical protein [Nocardioides kongjuensis]
MSTKPRVQIEADGDPRDLWFEGVAPWLLDLPEPIDCWVAADPDECRNPLPGGIGDVASANQITFLGFSVAQSNLYSLLVDAPQTRVYATCYVDPVTGERP